MKILSLCCFYSTKFFLIVIPWKGNKNNFKLGLEWKRIADFNGQADESVVHLRAEHNNKISYISPPKKYNK